MKKFSLIAVLLSAGILAACGNANQKAESAVDATKAAAGTAADATKAAAGTATDAAKNAAAGAATTAADAAKTATGAAVDATKNAADAAKTAPCRCQGLSPGAVPAGDGYPARPVRSVTEQEAELGSSPAGAVSSR